MGTQEPEDRQQPGRHVPDAGGGAAPDRAADRPAVAVFHSKLKLGVLVIPCALGIAMALQADGAEGFALANFTWTRLAAVAIPALVGFVLLQMAFERRPVLLLDEKGLHCRLPPIGLIPWPAVTGLEVGRAVLMRRVLMIAADQRLLGEQASAFARSSSGLAPLISPQLSQFQARTGKGQVCFYIPISLLSRPAGEIQHLAERYAGYASEGR
ncbi:MAG: hypothetical protein QF578_06340 [Alphaproteobacteria bacterium]|jgi:hypothetical protein|nr:hypothetical protein [Alphaproteobacteria bacterium]MDP6564428.1 hypothetical protein [Alphaproteobacteria bacterium]MDP6815621.1 hypothetical protein [Alphaproteobacteria bacterium]